MKKDKFEGLTLPTDSQSVAPQSGDNNLGKEPRTLDSVINQGEYNPLPDLDARIDSSYEKVRVLASMEPLIRDVYGKLDKIANASDGIKAIAGTCVARYLVTDQQVLRFETEFVKHFNEVLQKKAKIELRKFAFDLEHTRRDAVSDFNTVIHRGWWFSNKVGWILYMGNVITILLAVLYCYFK